MLATVGYNGFIMGDQANKPAAPSAEHQSRIVSMMKGSYSL
jgi:hypothetical protein